MVTTPSITERRTPYGRVGPADWATFEYHPAATVGIAAVRRSLAIAHVPARVRRALAGWLGLSTGYAGSPGALASAIQQAGAIDPFTEWWPVLLQGWATSHGQRRRALAALAALPGTLVLVEPAEPDALLRCEPPVPYTPRSTKTAAALRRRGWGAYPPRVRRGGGGLSVIVLPLRVLRRISRARGPNVQRLLNDRRHIRRSTRLLRRARPMVRLLQ